MKEKRKKYAYYAVMLLLPVAACLPALVLSYYVYFMTNKSLPGGPYFITISSLILTLLAIIFFRKRIEERASKLGNIEMITFVFFLIFWVAPWKIAERNIIESSEYFRLLKSEIPGIDGWSGNYTVALGESKICFSKRSSGSRRHVKLACFDRPLSSNEINTKTKNKIDGPHMESSLTPNKY